MYFIITIIIISLIVYIIDIDNKVINKEIMISNYNISYKFFNDEKIDNYIFSYLNDVDYIGIGNITYKLDKDNDLYYLTFYRYINNDNMIINSSNSFVINIDHSKIDRLYK